MSGKNRKNLNWQKRKRDKEAEEKKHFEDSTYPSEKKKDFHNVVADQEIPFQDPSEQFHFENDPQKPENTVIDILEQFENDPHKPVNTVFDLDLDNKGKEAHWLKDLLSKPGKFGQKIYKEFLEKSSDTVHSDRNLRPENLDSSVKARLDYALSQRRLKKHENFTIGSSGINNLQLGHQKLERLLSETNTAVKHLNTKLDVNHNSAQVEEFRSEVQDLRRKYEESRTETETLRTEVSGLREEVSGLQQQIETQRHTAVRPVEEEVEEEEEAHTARKTVPADSETDDSGVETQVKLPVAEGQAHSRESRQPRKTKLPSRKTDQRSTSPEVVGQPAVSEQLLQEVTQQVIHRLRSEGLLKPLAANEGQQFEQGFNQTLVGRQLEKTKQFAGLPPLPQYDNTEPDDSHCLSRFPVSNQGHPRLDRRECSGPRANERSTDSWNLPRTHRSLGHTGHFHIDSRDLGTTSRPVVKPVIHRLNARLPLQENHSGLDPWQQPRSPSTSTSVKGRLSTGAGDFDDHDDDRNPDLKDNKFRQRKFLHETNRAEDREEPFFRNQPGLPHTLSKSRSPSAPHSQSDREPHLGVPLHADRRSYSDPQSSNQRVRNFEDSHTRRPEAPLNAFHESPQRLNGLPRFEDQTEELNEGQFDDRRNLPLRQALGHSPQDLHINTAPIRQAETSSIGLKFSGEKLTTGQAIERVSPETPLLTLEKKEAREKQRASTQLFPATKQRRAPNSLESLSPTTSPIDRSVLTPDIRLQCHHQRLAEDEGDLHLQPRDVNWSDLSTVVSVEQQYSESTTTSVKNSRDVENKGPQHWENNDTTAKGDKPVREEGISSLESSEDWTENRPNSRSENFADSGPENCSDRDSFNPPEHLDDHPMTQGFSYTTRTEESFPYSQPEAAGFDRSTGIGFGKPRSEGFGACPGKNSYLYEARQMSGDELAPIFNFSEKHSAGDELLKNIGRYLDEGSVVQKGTRFYQQYLADTEMDSIERQSGREEEITLTEFTSSGDEKPSGSDVEDKSMNERRMETDEGMDEHRTMSLPVFTSTPKSQTRRGSDTMLHVGGTTKIVAPWKLEGKTGLKTSSKDEPLSSDSDDSEDGKKKEGKKRKKTQEGKKEEKDEYALPKPFSRSHSREGPVGRVLHDDIWKRWKQSIDDSNLDGIQSLLKTGDLPDNELFGQLCDKEGLDSNIVQNVCDAIGRAMKTDSEQILCVWSGYRPDNEDQIVFVACTSVATRYAKPFVVYPLNTFSVIFRGANDFSSEAKDILYSRESMDKMFTERERQNIRICIQENSKQLMQDHSNLTMISASPVRSVGFGTEISAKKPDTCIVLYMHVKGVVPLAEKPFPKLLKDSRGEVEFPVDVREGGFVNFSGHKASEPHSNLRIGCQIGSQWNQNYKGTLGAFVNLPDGTLGCITCAHVLLSDDHLNGLREKEMVEVTDLQNVDKFSRIFVYQPAIGEEAPIGHVCKAIFRVGGIGVTGVDVALVKLTDEQRHPITGCVPDGDHHHAGFTEENKMHFSSGEVSSCEPVASEHGTGLLKFGCSSGITRGGLYLHGPSVRRQTMSGTQMKFGFELHDQIECIPMGMAFAEPGDSGALVFIAKGGDHQKLKAIGIVEGGTTMNTVLLTPIWDVLDALGLPNKLKVFQHGSIFDGQSNAESTVEATAQCSPPLVFPSSSSQADLSKQYKRDDSGNGTISQSGSPTGTSQVDMMAAVTVTSTNNNNNINNNSNRKSNNSDSDGLVSVIANVSRIDSELQSQKSETQALKKEISELRKDFKKDSDQRNMQFQEMMKLLQANLEK